jgi:hypothetical protein
MLRRLPVIVVVPWTIAALGVLPGEECRTYSEERLEEHLEKLEDETAA